MRFSEAELKQPKAMGLVRVDHPLYVAVKIVLHGETLVRELPAWRAPRSHHGRGSLGLTPLLTFWPEFGLFTAAEFRKWPNRTCGVLRNRQEYRSGTGPKQD
jgi:hypothetical protein